MEEQRSSLVRTRGRRAAKYAGFTFLVLLLLILAALGALHLRPARQLVLRQAIAWLETQDIGLTADQLDYNATSLSLSLQNARLWSRTTSDLEPFLTASAIEVDLSVPELIRGRYVVDSARIRGVDLHYIVAADGRSNLPLPAKQAQQEPSAAVEYLVKDTVLEGGRVRFEDRRSGLDAALQIERLSVDGQPTTKRHDVELAAGPGQVQLEERRVDIDRVQAALDLGVDDVEVKRAELLAEQSRVELSGRVSNFATPSLDLAARAAIDVAAVTSAAAIPERLAGQLQVDATVRGAIGATLAEATLDSRNLAVRDLAPAAVNLRARHNASTGVVEVASLNVEGPWARVDGSGRIATTGSETSTLALRADGVDARTITAAFDLPYQLASRANAEVQVSMPGLAYDQASGTASVRLTPTGGLAPNVLPVDAVLQATASSGDAQLQIERLSAAGATLQGRVTVANRERLGGAVRLNASDLAVVVRQVEQLLGRRRGTLVAIPVAGAATVQTTLAGSVTDPAFDGTVDAPSLVIGTVEGVRLTARAAGTQAAVRLHELNAGWRTAAVRAAGEVSLTGRRAIALTADAANVNVSDALALGGVSEVPASGVASAQATVSGTLSTPVAQLRLGVNDVVAYQEPLGTLDVTARLDGSVAHVDSLRIEKPQAEGTGRLQASGDYHLQSRAYSYELTSENLRLEQLQLPDGTTVRTELDLSGSGRGTVADPAGTVQLAARSLTVTDRALGDVTAKVAVADGNAVVDAAAEQFALTAHAEAETTTPYNGRAEVVVDRLALDALPVELETPLAGTVSARITATGAAAAPADATVDASVSELDAVWNGQPIALDGPAAGRFADRIVTIDRLAVKALESTVAVSGRLPVDIDAEAGAIDLDARLDLATLAGYAPRGTDLSADGVLTVQGQVTGTTQAIDPDLAITLVNGLVVSPLLEVPITGITLDAAVRNGAATVNQLAANWGSAQVESSAQAPLSVLGELPVALPSSGDIRLTARVAGFDPASAPGVPEGVGGQIGLTVEASAPGANVEALSGRATFDQLELAFRELSLAQQQPSVIAAGNGLATIERLELEGSVGRVSASGSVGLEGARELNVVADGTLDIAAASVVTEAFTAEGPARFEVRATGTASDPAMNGFLELSDARLLVEDPADVAIESLSARVDLDGSRVVLSKLDGLVNGGTLAGSGTLTLGSGIIEDADLQLSVDELALSAPLDLRSLSNLGLRLTRQGEDLVIGGQVSIAEAGLTGDINFDTGILGVIGAPRGLDLTEERNPLLERLRLDIAVVTENPILIDNNLAKAELTTDVRVLGTPYELGMSGRMDLLEGSSVTLNERRYQVERGVVTFTDQRRITPAFDLQLTTEAGRYDITLGVAGAVGETETTLTSNPSLPEPDIMALLVTGRTLDEMRGEEYDVAREQVLSYLTGRVGSALGRGIERATGLSEVRIEPNLIANETDPGARLTVGQDLTRNLRLIYSADLADTSNQFWVAEYDITRRFQTRMVRQADNSYRLEFRHDVRFGGTPDPARVPRVRPKVRDVVFENTHPLGEEEARDRFGLKPGNDYDFFTARRGVDRLEESLRERGFLQSRVRATREESPEGVNLTVRIAPGPPVNLLFEGATPPKDVQEQIRLRWQRGVFDSQRGGDGREEIREWLVGDRYLDAKVDFRVEDVNRSESSAGTNTTVAAGATERREPSPQATPAGEPRRTADPSTAPTVAERRDPAATDRRETIAPEPQEAQPRAGAAAANVAPVEPQERRVVFTITPGTRFERVTLAFEGASGIEPDVLRDIVASQDLEGDLFTDPTVVTELLRRYYREEGYLAAAIEEPVMELAGTTARVVLRVNEGPLFMVQDVVPTGNASVPASEILAAVPLRAGDAFLPRVAERSLDLLRQLYWRRGYNEVRLRYEVDADRVTGNARVSLLIEEGRRAVVAAIDIRGNEQTSQDFVLGQLEVYPEGVLDLAALGRSRRSLYSTGAYSIVELNREAIAESPEEAPAGPEARETDTPVRVTATVREVQPFQVRYGASFDTERGPGGVFDLTNFNSLGEARQVGVGLRYDSQLRQARLFLSQPMLRRLPLQTTASAYVRQERNPQTDVSEAFNFDRIGVSLLQERRLANQYIWNYGLSYEQTRTFDPRPGAALDQTLILTPFTSSFLRETRDEVLDASRGSFISHAFTYAPGWLGADAAFLKYFGQFFKYFPLEPEKRERLTNEILRPRFVFATGVRFGLAEGLGTEVPLSERFFAGGSTSLRGFAQNAVGPLDESGIPIGGTATLILNNEVRFPLISIVDGVGFLDIGGVFPDIGDWSFSDIREAAGVGVRLRTPWFLIRGDYGFVLDRRPGERRSRFFFSIGQAF